MIEYKKGELIGNLIFVNETEPELQSGHKLRRADFKCNCGNILNTRISGVKAKKVKSCGCSRIISSSTHGKSESTEYISWEQMKRRCYNSNFKQYKDYGGRGIEVCDKWRNSFEEFYKDLGDKPTAGHSLDRINVNGNYEPGNCRWATREEQDRNRTNNVYLEHNGIRKILKDWSREFEIPYQTIQARLSRGIPLDKILIK